MNTPLRGGLRNVGLVEVHEVRLLALDGSRAANALARFIAALNANDGPRGLRLRAPVLLPNLGAEIELRNDVIVTLSAGTHEDGTATVRVTWFASQNESFPHLNGELRIVPATPLTAWLRFDACYRPMASTVRFAAPAENVIGHRIVLATARRLLRDVAAAVESSEGPRSDRGHIV